jgi:hypothetical protein
MFEGLGRNAGIHPSCGSNLDNNKDILQHIFWEGRPMVDDAIRGVINNQVMYMR